MIEQALWARARSNLYRFLSAAFLAPPDKALVGMLFRDGFMEDLEAVFGVEAVADLRQFIEGFQDDWDGVQQEFQDLFVVPLGRYVTPYEAVYRDERMIGDEVVRGLLMGPSTIAVKELYREAGTTLSEEVKELPDYIGLELACMEYLCKQEALGAEKGDPIETERVRDLQRRLIRDHLMQWVPALCARIRENAAGPFYRGIAGVTNVFLIQEGSIQ